MLQIFVDLTLDVYSLSTDCPRIFAALGISFLYSSFLHNTVNPTRFVAFFVDSKKEEKDGYWVCVEILFLLS